ncbi:MAG: hypothetical protein CBC47_03835 [Alphaproteobacteria bacterium TMED87]|nr:hypothetical protein [Rhodospirillaceae bacterium]OUV10149.1 MAG: hypothetical protein CBC47_03835 [Alphaproteobacteria bacterium TMED87]
MPSIEKSYGPLKGLRVLDCGTAIVGPWAATLLSFLGAKVIKLERPSGEITRLARPHQNGWSTAYTVANLCKMSAEVDYKDPKSKKYIETLLSEADVIIENFRPGVADRIGIGFKKAKSLNKNIVYASSSGWGDSGPMRDMSAVDSHLQAFSGFASLNGEKGKKPEILRYTHIDPSGGAFLAAGVLLGVLFQKRFGLANHIVTSHLAMSLTMQASKLAESLSTNKPIHRFGSECSASVPNACFLTLDKKYISISVQNNRQWNSFCKAIGDDSLSNDKRFMSNLLRVDNRNDLTEIISERIFSLPLRWWIIRFLKFNVPASPVMDADSLFSNTHVRDNKFIVDINTPHAGTIKTGGLPWSFTRNPASVEQPSSFPGEDTLKVLKEGFGQKRNKSDRSYTSPSGKLPLTGFKVIDLSSGYAGPFISLMLAESGALVKKVEIGDGDWSRELFPKSDKASAVFEAMNRNKEIIKFTTINDKSKSQIAKMIQESDIIIYDSNESSELDVKEIVKDGMHSKLISLDLSYYGEHGYLSGKEGSELTVQAMSGYLKSLGSIENEPIRVGADISESAAASMGLVSILAALYNREDCGHGDSIHVSRLGALMSLRSLQWAAVSEPDKWLGPSYCLAETDEPRYGYKTKDKNIFVSMMNLREESSFKMILKDLGMIEELERDDKFIKEGKNTIGMGYLTREYHHVWEKYFINFSSKELLEIFNRHGATAVEFLELNELFSNRQILSLNMIHDYRGNKFLRSPWVGLWPQSDIFTKF